MEPDLLSTLGVSLTPLAASIYVASPVNVAGLGYDAPVEVGLLVPSQ
jgi:hypothetical protein